MTREGAVRREGASASGRERLAAPIAAPMDLDAQRWAALVLATRDYVHKSGFSDVCVGLSGGVDSSLTAAVAVDALGADHVHGVLMPSRNSSEHSVTDAEKLAANLGIDARIVGIEPGHAALAEMLEPGLGDGLEPGGITDQNLQARIRGLTLMALANEHGWLVLTTGNKSELAVGYSTLYGDTAGAYAVVSDLWKLDVYELCRWRNLQAGSELIPATVLAKAPSAELAPGQRDDQSLPSYEVLDPILRLYVEELRSVGEIQQAQIAPPEVVEQVCRMVDTAEYKRRQTPIGPRLTGRAFGRDRRMPIINRYRGSSVALGTSEPRLLRGPREWPARWWGRAGGGRSVSRGYSVAQTARLVCALRWACGRLAEMLEGWAAQAAGTPGHAEVAAPLSELSRRLASHREALDGLQPDSELMAPWRQAAPADGSLAAALDEIAASEGSVERLDIARERASA